MKIMEVLDLVPNSDLIRIVEGAETIYAGYRGLLDKEIEGEVVKVSNTTEIWRKEQKYYGMHKGEIELVGQVKPDTIGLYNFSDMAVKLILQLNIKK